MEYLDRVLTCKYIWELTEFSGMFLVSSSSVPDSLFCFSLPHNVDTVITPYFGYLYLKNCYYHNIIVYSKLWSLKALTTFNMSKLYNGNFDTGIFSKSSSKTSITYIIHKVSSYCVYKMLELFVCKLQMLWEMEAEHALIQDE